MSALRKLISDHREALIVLAILLLLVLAFRAAPFLDPRVGFDGWSDVLYALVQSTKMMVVAYGAWYCKKLYHGETPDWLQWSREAGEEVDVDFHALIVDRLEYAFWATLWFCALFIC